MTPADRLRSLVKEATPGPWIAQLGQDGLAPRGTLYIVSTVDDAPETWQGVAECGFDAPEHNARLIALAPQLAELAADMAEALTRYCDPPVGTRFHDPDEAFVVLARLAALFPEDSA